MGRFLPLFVSVVGTLHVIGVSGQSPYECIGRCTNQIRDKFSEMQCPDANAAPCFCKNAVFPHAILECSQSCGATMDMISGYLTSGFCKGQDLVKPGPTAAASHSTSSKTESATSTAHASSVTSSTTAAEHAPITTPTTTPTPTPSSTSTQVDSTPSIPSETSSSAPAEKTPAEEASHSSTSASPSTTSEAAAGATSSAAAAAGPPSTGLSPAAIAGIGIGVGAAVLAIAAFIVCALMKGRKENKGHHADKMDISKPMPGSGRTYTTREDQYRPGRDPSLEKYGRGDIEMTANRYEDMVPRTQPRTLV
ncbi:hypothetical protein E4U53_003200 [Claviceps sorghi]|nr:hypothetical protein E4U53_003200 [Claviceps sorghi]